MDGSPILGRSPPSGMSSPGRKAVKSFVYFVKARQAWMAHVTKDGKAKYKTFKVLSPKSERRKARALAFAKAWVQEMSA